MTDERHRSLRDIPAPDLWPRIERELRAGGGPRGGGHHPGAPERQRLLAALIAVVVAAAGIGVAWAAFGRRAQTPIAPPPPAANPITVSANFPSVHARCSATLMTPVVRPGQSPIVRFRLTNTGTRGLLYGGSGGDVVVRDAAGGLLYSSAQAEGIIMGPVVAPTIPLWIGRTVTARSVDVGREVVAIWPGRLSLSYVCPFIVGKGHGSPSSGSLGLPPLPLRVAAAGVAPSSAVAIARAVGATGGLFGSCRPTAGGQSVVGMITPPRVSSPPKVQPSPMRARCWAEVAPHPGFTVVTLYFESPPNAPRVSLGRFWDLIRVPHLPTVEVTVWQFVVTPWQTVPAFGPRSGGSSATPSVDYSFGGGRWSAGGASCIGAVGYGGGGVFGAGSVTFPVPRNPC